MGSAFEQLPQAYRTAIEEVMADVVAEEDPEITTAFQEWLASSLLEGEVNNNDDISEDFEMELISFRAGWKAKEQA